VSRLWALLLAAVTLPACAGGSGDALQWLQRVATSAQKLTYTGVFMYRSGSQSETSRISHLVEGGNELERLEALDGSPREVIRHNDEIKCYLSESHQIIVERAGGRRAFPALLPVSLGGLSDSYVIRKGEPGRVAGLDSQAIIVEPKDDLRYGHRYWVDTQSGMLLKATMVDERGNPLETFTFTELRIGGPVDRNDLKPRLGAESGDWKVRNVRATETRGESSQWMVRGELPGFHRISSMRRQASPEAPESIHLVYSDGLAAVSVFIEPQGTAKEKPEVGEMAMGAINVYRRPLDNYRLVVMGDVPAATLKRLGDSIERRH
jgi:sigma-E factor negative regulatory protein RseB